MNKQRRKTIDVLITELEALKSSAEAILEDEQEAFENMPESLQDGERGERAQESIDCLETVVGSFEEIAESLESAKGE